MVSKRIASSLITVVVCFIFITLTLTTGCQQAEKATKINVNFKKWYAIGEGEGSTIEEAIEVADSTALALLAEKLNVKPEEIKNPSIHIRYLSPPKKRRERIGRKRVEIITYSARVEVRAPQDINPKQP